MFTKKQKKKNKKKAKAKCKLINHTHRKLVNLITLGPQPCLTQ